MRTRKALVIILSLAAGAVVDSIPRVSANSLYSDEAPACALPLPQSQATSEDDPEPVISAAAVPGLRVRMAPFSTPEDKNSHKMEYQLFLPETWKTTDSRTYPVVVFLHGSGDGQFSVMNSQSLPRLLANDQSTSFDSRRCWCLEPEYAAAEAMKEAPQDSPAAFLKEVEALRSPMADCIFAKTFEAIVVMPQGWLPESRTGWNWHRRQSVEKLTKQVMKTYRGDPTKVVLTGQSAGGAGAWHFAVSRPGLWSAVNVVCAPWSPSVAKPLEGKPVWVVGNDHDGVNGNDAVVEALKQRQAGETRYTRYLNAPAPPDPQYRGMLGHASYDLIYRDPRLWSWAFDQTNPNGKLEWARVVGG